MWGYRKTGKAVWATRRPFSVASPTPEKVPRDAGTLGRSVQQKLVLRDHGAAELIIDANASRVERGVAARLDRGLNAGEVDRSLQIVAISKIDVEIFAFETPVSSKLVFRSAARGPPERSFAR
jgi:hypothetical protein